MRRIGHIACLSASLLLALVLAPAAARAQAWPQRTVRIIVPLPPGAGTDIAARLFAERLSARWGQPVVVENRQGADGIPAVAGFVSAHDNHTLLFSFGGVITINPLVHDKLPYDPEHDLVPISAVTNNFLAIAATGSLRGRQHRAARADDPRPARQAQLGGDAGAAALRIRRVAQGQQSRDGAGGLPRLHAGAAGFPPGPHPGRRHLDRAAPGAGAGRQRPDPGGAQPAALSLGSRRSDHRGGRPSGIDARRHRRGVRLEGTSRPSSRSASPPTSAPSGPIRRSARGCSPAAPPSRPAPLPPMPRSSRSSASRSPGSPPRSARTSSREAIPPAYLRDPAQSSAFDVKWLLSPACRIKTMTSP